jgi:hypothetical protein
MSVTRSASVRPGAVVFAAVVTFAVAVVYALFSLTEFANSTWVVTSVHGYTYNLFSAHYFWWAIFDVVVAVIALAAGMSMLRGGSFGLIMGFIGAGAGIFRWMFYFPVTPWLSLTIVVINVAVIWALCSSIDWFSEQSG